MVKQQTIALRYYTTHKIQWLSDNGQAYVAHETIEFGRRIGLEICTTYLIVKRVAVWLRHWLKL